MRQTINFLILLIYSQMTGQNHVSNNGQAVNYGNIDINKGLTWTTARTSTPGTFTNNGAAALKDGTTDIVLTSTPAKWVNGYVKHFATATSTSYVYPVGSTASRMFLWTSNETVGSSIAVAWIEGDPSNINYSDLTAPNSGVHSIALLDSGILSVNSLGQWDWIGTYTGTVSVSVKLPSTASKSNLRLVGWNGEKWTNLGTSGSSGGVLSGNVPATITALAIGSTTTNSSTKTAQEIDNGEQLISDFIVYPNPSDKGHVTVDFTSNYIGEGKLDFFDGLGKSIKTEKINIRKTNTITINTGNLATGIYFIQLKDNASNPLSDSYKLIIQ